jgi:TolB-like protein
LKRELGIVPQPETTELARAIRNRGEGTEINARPGSPPAAKPGKKLRRPQASGLLPPVYAPPPRWGRIAAVLTAVCVVVAGVGFAINRPKPVSEAHTLLIVPFTNDSTHEVQDLPIAGISSLVAEELSETHSLRVSSYRADASGATKVHDHLAANPAVRYVVEGRVSSSSIFDIAIQLTDRNGTTLWSNRYARPRGGVLDIVDDITEHISRAVAADGALVRNSAAPVENAKQVARELLALSTFVRQDTSGSSAAALLQIARKAVAFDPQNPEALALLANGYLAHFTMSRERNDLAEADRYLERALALDPTSVLALWATSLLRRMQHRYADALVFCRRVIAINPHHAGGLREIGHDLIALHDPAEAVPWFRAAIEAAPNDPFVDVAYSGISEAEMEQEHGEKSLAAAYDAVRHDHRGSLAMLRLAAMLEIADQHTEAQSVVVQFYQRHSEFPASDGRAFRLITGYSPKC